MGFLHFGRALIRDRWCFLHTCAVALLDPSGKLHTQQDNDGTLFKASLALG